ncbi:hypothetical protein NDU88_000490 [Pleurodeles waltl]|uniref:Uncharacterized protein n=1 Tax=Pleurodeles waltl TaxID=8319 RepID=A0AAV7NAJ1_PLEWA|nr:hypothetical protein NDU88_000490 [Pleurodeles waltl]
MARKHHPGPHLVPVWGPHGSRVHLFFILPRGRTPSTSSDRQQSGGVDPGRPESGAPIQQFRQLFTPRPLRCAARFSSAAHVAVAQLGHRRPPKVRSRLI